MAEGAASRLRSTAGGPRLCVPGAQLCLLPGLFPSPPLRDLSTGAQGLGGGSAHRRVPPLPSALTQGKGVVWGPFLA